MNLYQQVDPKIIALANRWNKNSHGMNKETESFIRLLELGMTYNLQGFLDLGAGNGTKIVLAAAVGFDAVGYEYNDANVQQSESLLQKARRLGVESRMEMIKGDYSLLLEEASNKQVGIWHVYHTTEQFEGALRCFAKHARQDTILLGSGNVPPDEQKIIEQLNLRYEQHPQGRIYRQKI